MSLNSWWALRAGHADACARFSELHDAPAGLTIDIEAELMTAHSEKEKAAGDYKHGFGFQSLHAYADETREALGGDAATRQRRGTLPQPITAR